MPIYELYIRPGPRGKHWLFVDTDWLMDTEVTRVSKIYVDYTIDIFGGNNIFFFKQTCCINVKQHLIA